MGRRRGRGLIRRAPGQARVARLVHGHPQRQRAHGSPLHRQLNHLRRAARASRVPAQPLLRHLFDDDPLVSLCCSNPAKANENVQMTSHAPVPSAAAALPPGDATHTHTQQPCLSGMP